MIDETPEEREISEAIHAFHSSLSITEINSQLFNGLIGSVEHAKYVLEVWENFKRLPQYSHLRLK